MPWTENLKQHGGRAVLLGVLNAILLSLVMVPAFRAGIPPMPQPPSVAFASLVLGGQQPLPVGLAFHLIYVTFWSALFVIVTYPRLTFARALGLGVFLWLIVLVIFFPLIGWGFLGLGVGPQLVIASLVPHLLFSIFLWALSRSLFRAKHGAQDRTQTAQH